jgi:hypothetical protein
LPPPLSGSWSAVADGDADGSRARPVRQVHGAAHCGGQRLHQRQRGAARRRRRSDHHEQQRVTPCRPQAAPTGHTHLIGAGERLANTHKHKTSSTRTTRRWRRRGRRIAALLPHARRSLPPASSRTPRVHSRGAACRGRVLRRRPTHPRHDLRVALRAILRSHRTAEGRARTYRIAAHSEGCAAQAALTGTWLATHCEFGFVSAQS